MWIFLTVAAHASDSFVALEAGPTGPTAAIALTRSPPWIWWFGFTVVADPASVSQWARREGRLPVPVPGFSFGASRMGALGPTPLQYRAGLGYNMLALEAGLAFTAIGEPWGPWLLLAGAEAEAHVLLPALGPRIHLSAGVHPRGYAAMAVTEWAQADEPAVLWTVLGPTLGIQFSD